MDQRQPLPCATEVGIRPQLRKESLTRFVGELAARQHGLVSLVQVLAMGMSAAAVQRRVRSGAWELVLPGVYRVRGAPVSFWQRVMAAMLWAGPAAVASHATAGTLWKLDGIRTEHAEITLPPGRGKRHTLIVMHRSSLGEADRSEVAGIPCTSAARTVIDMAADLDDEALEIVMESGFRMGLYRESFLRWRLAELGGKGRAGSRRLLTLLDERGKGAAALEYPLEVKMWRLLKRSRLPLPVRQHEVRINGRRYRLDFAWPDRKVAVECDGYETHGGRVAFRRDRRKLAAVAAAGYRVIPVTWEDVTKYPEDKLTEVGAALAPAA